LLNCIENFKFILFFFSIFQRVANKIEEDENEEINANNVSPSYASENNRKSASSKQKPRVTTGLESDDVSVRESVSAARIEELLQQQKVYSLVLYPNYHNWEFSL
jgi:hypothetical protein